VFTPDSHAEFYKNSLNGFRNEIYAEGRTHRHKLLGNATNNLSVLDLTLDLLDIRQAEVQLIMPGAA
jgi:hypothetical protein